MSTKSQDKHNQPNTHSAVNMNNIKPLHDRVLLQINQSEVVTKGGIVLPVDNKEGYFIAEVRAIGPGAKDADGKTMQMSVAVGDKVLCGKYAGTELGSENGQMLKIVKESDIMGKL